MKKFPLAWPDGWKRTPVAQRKSALFSKRTWRQTGTAPGDGYYLKGALSVAEATTRVLEQLRALGVREGDEIISTNLELRLDGLPRSNQREPADPGVAVYWKKGKDAKHKVMAIDQYTKVADNLAAIAATLEAMRAIERHGGAVILERAFTGFDALPSPNDWRHVLNFRETPTLEQAKQRYYELAIKNHPDQGGSAERMAEINRAWEDAQRELKS